MKTIAFLLIFISFNCHAAEIIDEKLVMDFLANEKRFVQSKNIDGLMSLFCEDFISADKDGKIKTKSDFRTGLTASFINASKLLHNSKIKSLSIAADRKTAEVILDNESKALIEFDDYKRVISDRSTTKSLLVIDNGNIKYKNNQYLGSF